jgi:hypothetical protein
MKNTKGRAAHKHEACPSKKTKALGKLGLYEKKSAGPKPFGEYLTGYWFVEGTL